MGLDMYGYTMPVSFVGERQTDVKAKNGEEHAVVEKTDIAYWRKFNHLHGWMENLYYAKGGKAKSFNCCNVRLELADLDRLEQALDENTLEHTPGFFFGGEEIYPEDITETRQFIQKGREAINNGLAVFYDSWW